MIHSPPVRIRSDCKKIVSSKYNTLGIVLFDSTFRYNFLGEERRGERGEKNSLSLDIDLDCEEERTVKREYLCGSFYRLLQGNNLKEDRKAESETSVREWK